MTKCKDCIYYMRMKTLPNVCNNPKATEYCFYMNENYECKSGISIKEREQKCHENLRCFEEKEK